MTRETVFEGLKDIISTVKPKLDLTGVNENSRLVTDLGVDSLSMLLLSLAAENKFHITFDPNTPPFQTVGDVVDYIVKVLPE